MGSVAKKAVNVGKYVFPVTGLPLLINDGVQGIKKHNAEMKALAAEATPKPPAPPPLAPDATDELVRQARLAARQRELMARGRKSTFSTLLGG